MITAEQLRAAILELAWGLYDAAEDDYGAIESFALSEYSMTRLAEILNSEAP